MHPGSLSLGFSLLVFSCLSNKDLQESRVGVKIYYTGERKDNSFQNIQVVGEDTITPLRDHDLESKAPRRSGR
jgi:protein-tyrosine phosphatase